MTQGEPEPPDADLVRAVVSPEHPADREAAAAAIWERHHRAVGAYCLARLADLSAVEDVVAETFAVALRDLTEGRPPRHPDRLRAWLYGIALNRCRQEWRRRRRVGPMPEYEVDDEDDAYERANLARRAEVDRLMGIVTSTLTDRQRLVYELNLLEGMKGADLAHRLGISTDQAYRLASESRERIYTGFGALVLVRAGRPPCKELEKILDRVRWDGEHFTAKVRNAVVRHLDDCATCGDCRACRERSRRLVAPYVPALTPLLLGPELYDRVMDEAGLRQGRRDRKERRGGGEDGGGGIGGGIDGAGGEGGSGERRSPAPAADRLSRAVVALAALIGLLVTGAAVLLRSPSASRQVPLQITVITGVAAVTDIPGRATRCTVDLRSPRTDCTKVLRVEEGKTSPITVVPAPGSTVSLRYFGCDDAPPEGTTTCDVTPEGPRTVCITTSAAEDLPNVAECRRRTG